MSNTHTSFTPAVALKNLYNIDHVMPTGSLIALIRYEFDRKQLIVTFRKDGQTFCYKQVPNVRFHSFISYHNKPAYLSRYIHQKYESEKLTPVPADVLARRIASTSHAKIPHRQKNAF